MHGLDKVLKIQLTWHTFMGTGLKSIYACVPHSSSLSGGSFYIAMIPVQCRLYTQVKRTFSCCQTFAAFFPFTPPSFWTRPSI